MFYLVATLNYQLIQIIFNNILSFLVMFLITFITKYKNVDIFSGTLEKVTSFEWFKQVGAVKLTEQVKIRERNENILPRI